MLRPLLCAALSSALASATCRSAEPTVGSKPHDRDLASSADAAAPTVDSPQVAMPAPALPPALEAELTALRQGPDQAVGFGEKAYLPYVANGARGLMNLDDPAVTQRLVAELRGAGDRVTRLALLHVLGGRHDAGVDAALIALLDDATLRATAAYLLGAVNMKGHPTCPRDAAAAAPILAALRRWVDDATPFEDPFYKRTFRTGDFALAAFVRVAGPERFTISRDLRDLIGFALPTFDAGARADLLAQAAAMP